MLLAVTSCSDIRLDFKDDYLKSVFLTTKQVEYVNNGLTFDFDFIRQTNAQETGDWLISPLSMKFLLGILLNGAQGNTAQDICRVLGYGTSETEDINNLCLAMLQHFPELDKSTQLSLANAVFADRSLPIRPLFKQTIENKYLGTADNLDFSNASWARTVNQWCSDNTKGMISHIIDADAEILFIAMNALYFKGKWKEKFAKSDTEDEYFTLNSGSKRKIPMMKQSGNHFFYCEQSDFQVLKLPYGNRVFSMYIILPKEGIPVRTVISGLTADKWRQIISNMDDCVVNLWLPRFERVSNLDMNDILIEMGLSHIFGDGDFSGFSPSVNHIDLIKQDIALKICEEGTEAAVVSQAIGVGAAFSKDVVVHADHPFLYLITEDSTGSVMFAGCFAGEE